MGEELNRSELISAKTSCGGVSLLHTTAQGTRYIKTHYDFRKLAKHKLDAIFRAASEARRKNTIIHKYLEQLSKSISKKKLLELLD